MRYLVTRVMVMFMKTTNETPFAMGRKHMAAMVGALDDAALRKVWRLTVRLVDMSDGGTRKAELLGELDAVAAEGMRRHGCWPAL